MTPIAQHLVANLALARAVDEHASGRGLVLQAPAFAIQPDDIAVFGGGKPTQVPKVMQVIHSERDTTAEVDGARVDDALRVVEQGLRAWDASITP